MENCGAEHVSGAANTQGAGPEDLRISTRNIHETSAAYTPDAVSLEPTQYFHGASVEWATSDKFTHGTASHALPERKSSSYELNKGCDQEYSVYRTGFYTKAQEKPLAGPETGVDIRNTGNKSVSSSTARKSQSTSKDSKHFSEPSPATVESRVSSASGSIPFTPPRTIQRKGQRREQKRAGQTSKAATSQAAPSQPVTATQSSILQKYRPIAPAPPPAIATLAQQPPYHLLPPPNIGYKGCWQPSRIFRRRHTSMTSVPQAPQTPHVPEFPAGSSPLSQRPQPPAASLDPTRQRQLVPGMQATPLKLLQPLESVPPMLKTSATTQRNPSLQTYGSPAHPGYITKKSTLVQSSALPSVSLALANPSAEQTKPMMQPGFSEFKTQFSWMPVAQYLHERPPPLWLPSLNQTIENLQAQHSTPSNSASRSQLRLGMLQMMEVPHEDRMAAVRKWLGDCERARADDEAQAGSSLQGQNEQAGLSKDPFLYHKTMPLPTGKTERHVPSEQAKWPRFPNASTVTKECTPYQQLLAALESQQPGGASGHSSFLQDHYHPRQQHEPVKQRQHAAQNQFLEQKNRLISQTRAPYLPHGSSEAAVNVEETFSGCGGCATIPSYPAAQTTSGRQRLSHMQISASSSALPQKSRKDGVVSMPNATEKSRFASKDSTIRQKTPGPFSIDALPSSGQPSTRKPTGMKVSPSYAARRTPQKASDSTGDTRGVSKETQRASAQTSVSALKLEVPASTTEKDKHSGHHLQISMESRGRTQSAREDVGHSSKEEIPTAATCGRGARQKRGRGARRRKKKCKSTELPTDKAGVAQEHQPASVEGKSPAREEKDGDKSSPEMPRFQSPEVSSKVSLLDLSGVSRISESRSLMSSICVEVPGLYARVKADDFLTPPDEAIFCHSNDKVAAYGTITSTPVSTRTRPKRPKRSIPAGACGSPKRRRLRLDGLERLSTTADSGVSD